MATKAWAEAKCVDCKAKRKIYAGDVRPGDMPMCVKCGSIMVSTGRAGAFDPEPRREG